MYVSSFHCASHFHIQELFHVYVCTTLAFSTLDHARTYKNTILPIQPRTIYKSTDSTAYLPIHTNVEAPYLSSQSKVDKILL